jgi:hypothetical protein
MNHQGVQEFVTTNQRQKACAWMNHQGVQGFCHNESKTKSMCLDESSGRARALSRQIMVPA